MNDKIKTVLFKMPRGFIPTGRTGLKIKKDVMFYEVEIIEQCFALLLKESIKK